MFPQVREHGDRNDLPISGFGYGAQARARMEFFSVKRVQVHGYIVNVYAYALFSQIGKKRRSIGAQDV